MSRDGVAAEIKTALDTLNFDTTPVGTVAPESAEANERSVLTIALRSTPASLLWNSSPV